MMKLNVVFKDYDKPDYEFSGSDKVVSKMIDTIDFLKRNGSGNESFELNRPDGSVIVELKPTDIEKLELSWNDK